jgi:hypothetical protein
MITIEELKTYEQIETKLSKICEEWTKQNLDNKWQHYCNFYIRNEHIFIQYSYNDIVYNIEYETCYCTTCVSWEDMVEFSKTLEL